GFGAFAAVDGYAGDVRLPVVDAIADESRHMGAAGGDRLRAGFARVAAALALLFHGGFETSDVDADALGAQDVLRHIEWKPEGVVEAECDGTRQLRGAGVTQRRSFLLQQRQSLVEGFAEALLPAADHLLDVRLRVGDLRIGSAHGVNYGLRDAPQKRAVEPQQARVTGSASQNTAQYVPPPVVARLHSIRDQKGQRPAVVG